MMILSTLFYFDLFVVDFVDVQNKLSLRFLKVIEDLSNISVDVNINYFISNRTYLLEVEKGDANFQI